MLPLRGLIGFQSLKVLVVRDLSNYYSSDFLREMITFQSYHNYAIEYFYLACFLASIVTVFVRQDNKEEKIQRLEENLWCIKLFLLIFTMIFTKNIENAI
jgi:uncharacterized membrane protein